MKMMLFELMNERVRFVKQKHLIVQGFLLVVIFMNAGWANAQPDAPSKLYFHCEPPYRQLTLNWQDNSSNETGCVIQRKLDSGDWMNWVTINSADVTTYMKNDYDRSSSAEYRVCSFNGNGNSSWSNEIRVVGTESGLEVYPEVPGIRAPKVDTINGITFSEIQDQCPAEPENGKATRISTYYSIKVGKVGSSGGDFITSPVYETRPQVRNYLMADDPANSGGHRPYGYGAYGPNSSVPNRTMNSHHWTNFDASEDVVVQIKLLDAVPEPQTINMEDLEIFPEPLEVSKIDETTLELTLPGASDYCRHYRIGFNKVAWSSNSGRSENVLEAPLFIFINPLHLAPASAPQNEIKEFDNGKLVVFGAGIFLPNDKYRFFGEGENSTCREMYAPGDAYLHYGFVFNNDSYAMKVWGRAIYSDEMFDLYLSSTEYDYSVPGRTPWSDMDCAAGNTWGLNPNWEGRVGFFCEYYLPTVFEGFTNIGGRMGPEVQGKGNMELINHKDVGYGGGTYQTSNTKAYYKGCLLVNDDDVTYVHENYTMEYCTSFNLVNGPSFQFGWGKFDKFDISTHVLNHTIFSSDRKSGDTAGKNHGVFNSRLNLEKLRNHNGGYFENFDFWGEENIVFKLRIWDEYASTPNTISILGDVVFKNFNIRKTSRLKNEIIAEQNTLLNKNGYIRFLHFDNLTIEGNAIENIDDGNNFTYNEGALLHTITFFSLPNPVDRPAEGNAPIGQNISIFSAKSSSFVQMDSSLPASFDPICANTSSNTTQFTVVDAGDGYIALKAKNGYFVKADSSRYGYLYTEPDIDRGDLDTKNITNDAKFVWVEKDGDKFALYSKVMGLYVRAENNCGPNNPLYAASSSIGDSETFSTSQNVAAAEILDNSTFKVYPNPASRYLIVETNIYRLDEIAIYSINGKAILSKKIDQAVTRIDISQITKGMYFIIAQVGNRFYHRKLVIE